MMEGIIQGEFAPLIPSLEAKIHTTLVIHVVRYCAIAGCLPLFVQTYVIMNGNSAADALLVNTILVYRLAPDTARVAYLERSTELPIVRFKLASVISTLLRGP